jgi:hypothetical protein
VIARGASGGAATRHRKGDFHFQSVLKVQAVVNKTHSMRIAISGSHSLGKSTVVNEWVAKNPAFHREEEPYRALGLYGPYEILFRDASTKLHNGIQM